MDDSQVTLTQLTGDFHVRYKSIGAQTRCGGGGELTLPDPSADEAAIRMVLAFADLTKSHKTDKIYWGLFPGPNAYEKDVLTAQIIVSCANNYTAGRGAYALLALKPDQKISGRWPAESGNSGAFNRMMQDDYLVTSQVGDETRVHVTTKLLSKVASFFASKDFIANHVVGAIAALPVPGQG